MKNDLWGTNSEPRSLWLMMTKIINNQSSHITRSRKQQQIQINPIFRKQFKFTANKRNLLSCLVTWEREKNVRAAELDWKQGNPRREWLMWVELLPPSEELVDVRQCHCAQWNIHRSAFLLPLWLLGWVALIFLSLYTPLSIKRTRWVAHATAGYMALETWRWYRFRTGHLQGTQLPLTPPNHSIFSTAPKKITVHTDECYWIVVKVAQELVSAFGKHQVFLFTTQSIK